MKIRDATNTLRTIKGIKVRDATNTLRTLKGIKIRDATNTLRAVLAGSGAGSAAVLRPLLVQGSVASVGSPRATTSPATITMNGGVAPYSVVWYPDVDWSATNPTSLVTAFRSPPLFSGDLITGSVYAIVTDSTGTTFTTNTIQMTAANYYNGMA